MDDVRSYSFRPPLLIAEARRHQALVNIISHDDILVSCCEATVVEAGAS